MQFYVVLNQLQDGTYEHNFYAGEDYELTGFQLELKSKTNNITGIKGSPALLDFLSLEYNLNLSPDIIRVLSAAKTGKDAQLKAGETWFTVYTKSSVKFLASYYKNFKHEYIFNSATKFFNGTEIKYLKSALRGESVRLSQDLISQIIINSDIDIKSIEIIHSNGKPVLEEYTPIEAKQVLLNTQGLHAGLYLARIRLINENIVTKKFIVLY